MKSTFKKLVKLNNNHIQEISKLIDECNTYDQTNLSIEFNNFLNFNSKIKTFYLYYQDNALISLIFLHIPSEEEAFATLFTKPSFRNQDVLLKLFSEVCAELNLHNIAKLYLVTEPDEFSKSLPNYLPVKYDYSEYVMELDLKNPSSVFDTKETNRQSLEISEASAIELFDNREILQTYTDYFSDFTLEDFESYLACKTDKAYKITKNSSFIGSTLIYYQGHSAYIYCFGINDKMRNKGYGKAFLYLLLEMLQTQSCLEANLQVSGKNKLAYSLYEKAGFFIIEQLDYYNYLMP